MGQGKGDWDTHAMLEAELGVTATQARKTLQERADGATPEPEQQVGNGQAGLGRGHKTPDDVSRLYGNDTDYWTRRLARDRPDILARVQSGELATMRAARHDQKWTYHAKCTS